MRDNRGKSRTRKEGCIYQHEALNTVPRMDAACMVKRIDQSRALPGAKGFEIIAVGMEVVSLNKKDLEVKR